MVAVHLEVCVHLNLKNKNKQTYNSGSRCTTLQFFSYFKNKIKTNLF